MTKQTYINQYRGALNAIEHFMFVDMGIELSHVKNNLQLLSDMISGGRVTDSGTVAFREIKKFIINDAGVELDLIDAELETLDQLFVMNINQ
jgi:hypothetical protein